jgi:glycosyltransferase involved in cell wall biosynthesis
MVMELPHAPISVVIPAFNEARFIGEALESVSRQTRPVAEVIVVDDGSSDATASIAEAGGATVHRQANRGLSAARNAGVRAATQPWVAFLDADDLWEPTKIERQWDATELCPEAGMVSCDFSQFEDGRVTAASFLARPDVHYDPLRKTRPAEGVGYFPKVEDPFFISGFFLFPSAVVVRHDLLMSVGLFDEKLRFIEDRECFFRVLARAPLAVVEQPLMRYRLHEHNMSKNAVEMHLTFVEIIEKIAAEAERFPPSLVQAWRDATPQRLVAAARLMMDKGEFDEARSLLAESFRRKPSLRALACWSGTWLRRSYFQRLVALKRSSGIRFGGPEAP